MIVFRQISWAQFAVLLSAVVLLYYGFVGWHYYKPELKALLQKLQQGKQDEPQVDDTAPVIMGASRAEEGISEVGTEELIFDVPVEQQEDLVKREPVKEPSKRPQNRVSPLMQQISRDHQAAMLGNVADAMEEIKTLLDMAKENGEAKEALLDTLQLLTPKLQALSGTTYPDALKLYLLDEIRKRFSFEMVKADLEPLWHTGRRAKSQSI